MAGNRPLRGVHNFSGNRGRPQQLVIFRFPGNLLLGAPNTWSNMISLGRHVLVVTKTTRAATNPFMLNQFDFDRLSVYFFECVYWSLTC